MKMPNSAASGRGVKSIKNRLHVSGYEFPIHRHTRQKRDERKIWIKGFVSACTVRFVRAGSRTRQIAFLNIWKTVTFKKIMITEHIEGIFYNFHNCLV